LYVTDILYGAVPDADVSENSNSTYNEEPEYQLSEEEIESDSGNVSDGSVGFQKSQHSYSAVTATHFVKKHTLKIQ
jgi:hypothetical protein